jgi:single-strand DNA-binding protein
MAWSQTIIIGNVGRDPEFKYTPQGTAVCDFSVAVNKRTGKGENRQEKTVWFRVTAWRERAEFASQYVKKGSRIMVVGEIEARAYIDKQGQAAATLELTANNIQLLDSRAEAQSEDQGARASGGAGAGAAGEGVEDVSDIPF